MLRKTSEHNSDYPLEKVPLSERKGFWSLASVLFGFTFVTYTMLAGASLGAGYDSWGKLSAVILIGSAALGFYASIISYIAYCTGLNALLLCRFSFGELGSKFSDSLLGFTQLGWYAVGTAVMADLSINLLKLPENTRVPIIIICGLVFCWTAFIGYRGLEVFSYISVPIMLLLIATSGGIAINLAYNQPELLKHTAVNNLNFSTGITMVIGTFVSGGTQASNWTRYAKSGRSAVISTLLAFFFANGLMLVYGAFCSFVYREPDLVNVLVLQGLTIAGGIMLILNLWSTQDNTIYNWSLAGSNLFRTERRKEMTVIGAVIGVILSLLGLDKILVTYLTLLGTIIPPLGGVLIADFLVRKGNYPDIKSANLAKVYLPGFISYTLGCLVAFSGFGVPSLLGIIVSFLSYILVTKYVFREKLHVLLCVLK